MTTNMNIARTIQTQLGGGLYMVGAKNLLALPEETRDEDFILGGLQFAIMKNAKGVTHVRIELHANDTYIVSFHKVNRRTFETKETARFDGVYADSLRHVIESNTGLYMKL